MPFSLSLLQLEVLFYSTEVFSRTYLLGVLEVLTEIGHLLTGELPVCRLNFSSSRPDCGGHSMVAMPYKHHLHLGFEPPTKLLESMPCCGLGRALFSSRHWKSALGRGQRIVSRRRLPKTNRSTTVLQPRALDQQTDASEARVFGANMRAERGRDTDLPMFPRGCKVGP